MERPLDLSKSGAHRDLVEPGTSTSGPVSPTIEWPFHFDLSGRDGYLVRAQADKANHRESLSEADHVEQIWGGVLHFQFVTQLNLGYEEITEKIINLL